MKRYKRFFGSLLVLLPLFVAFFGFSTRSYADTSLQTYGLSLQSGSYYMIDSNGTTNVPFDANGVSNYNPTAVSATVRSFAMVDMNLTYASTTAIPVGSTLSFQMTYNGVYASNYQPTADGYNPVVLTASAQYSYGPLVQTTAPIIMQTAISSSTTFGVATTTPAYDKWATASITFSFTSVQPIPANTNFLINIGGPGSPTAQNSFLRGMQFSTSTSSPYILYVPVHQNFIYNPNTASDVNNSNQSQAQNQVNNDNSASSSSSSATSSINGGLSNITSLFTFWQSLSPSDCVVNFGNIHGWDMTHFNLCQGTIPAPLSALSWLIVGIVSIALLSTLVPLIISIWSALAKKDSSVNLNNTEARRILDIFRGGK